MERPEPKKYPFAPIHTGIGFPDGLLTRSAQDIAPGMYEVAAKAGYKYGQEQDYFGEPVTYKDLAYVRAETERLAEQAKAAACP
jgi:hypothetical protein